MFDKRFNKKSAAHKMQVSVYGDELHIHISKKKLMSLFPEAKKLNVVVSEDDFSDEDALLNTTF